VLLQPTTTEPFRLSSGDTIAIPKATPRLPIWRGTPPSSTYGGKPIVDHGGRPAFAELVILWSLQAEGWHGAWVTHGGGREIYRVGLMDVPPVSEVPSPLRQRLSDIRAIRGTSKGTWDVCCYRDGSFLFAESKRRGRDRIKPDQEDWLEVALGSGLEPSSFLVVEWDSDERMSPSQSIAPHANEVAAVQPSPELQVYEPKTDPEYYGWLDMHQHGYLLNVQGKQQPMLHRADCPHIDRHNNAGAMTQRNSRKICSENRAELRRWLEANGYSMISRKCRSCL